MGKKHTERETQSGRYNHFYDYVKKQQKQFVYEPQK